MGACEPDEEDARSCGTCQAEIRVCQSDCSWGDYGSCSGAGQCEPQQRDQESCGDCGVRSRICGNDCIWGDWSACAGEGSCEPDATSYEDCGACVSAGNCGVGECEAGTRALVCTDLCEWGTPGACQGNVDPVYDVPCDDVDQDCDGADATVLDLYEPDDDCGTANYLGTDPDRYSVISVFGEDGDSEDWYYFLGDDSFGSGEGVWIWLRDIPAGSDYDLFLYKIGTNQTCADLESIGSSEAGGNSDEQVYWDESLGGDTANYLVQVKKYLGAPCAGDYELLVHGLLGDPGWGFPP
jgi:hypothetical protein